MTRDEDIAALAAARGWRFETHESDAEQRLHPGGSGFDFEVPDPDARIEDHVVFVARLALNLGEPTFDLAVGVCGRELCRVGFGNSPVVGIASDLSWAAVKAAVGAR